MAKHRTKTGRKQGRGNWPRRRDEVRELPLVKALVSVRAGLSEVCTAAGLRVLEAMMEEDREALCGPRYAHEEDRQVYRYGKVPGTVVLAGRRVEVRRPRARSVGGGEVPLPSYLHFADEDPLTRAAMERMLVGVSTRHYGRTLDPVSVDLEVSGVSKSAVSRRFVARTLSQLEEWMRRPLAELDLAVLLLDGLEIVEHTVIVALGIDTSGKKHLLGVWEGTTENSTVCKALLADLVDRGVPADRSILVVLDGGKGLRKATRQVFGRRAVIQRCQVHKMRNVLEHLPERMRPSVKRAIQGAYKTGDFEKAKGMLLALARKLEVDHPGAAASLREGLDEALTVLSLGVGERLAGTLSSTNAIESAFSGAREVMGNVKRWRGGRMILRWTVAGLQEVEGRFRRVKGKADMPRLVAALRARDEKDEARQVA